MKKIPSTVTLCLAAALIVWLAPAIGGQTHHRAKPAAHAAQEGTAPNAIADGGGWPPCCRSLVADGGGWPPIKPPQTGLFLADGGGWPPTTPPTKGNGNG
jgi:hypothetical protein